MEKGKKDGVGFVWFWFVGWFCRVILVLLSLLSNLNIATGFIGINLTVHHHHHHHHHHYHNYTTITSQLHHNYTTINHNYNLQDEAADLLSFLESTSEEGPGLRRFSFYSFSPSPLLLLLLSCLSSSILFSSFVLFYFLLFSFSLFS